MRASSTFSRDAGTSTSSKSAIRPLRIRVRKSATGSVVDIGGCSLPARLGQSRHVALVGHLAQADPAQPELAVERARAAASAAPVVPARLELGRSLLTHDLGRLCHLALVLLRSGARLRALLALGALLLLGRDPLLVGLGVLCLQLLERRLLGLGSLPRLLLAAVLLGVLGRGSRRRIAGPAVAGERHPERLEERERLLVGLGGRRDRHI